MPRFDANLNYLFTELPFLDRFAAAAECGFRGIEILVPYEAPAAAIRQRLEAAGIEAVLINTPLGDPAKGDRGLTCVPGREADFKAAFSRALEYAAELRCPRIHVVAGVMPPGADRDRFDGTYRANLAWAAPEAAKAGITLCLEPINPRDIPGFFLNTAAQARTVIETLGQPNIRLQYDLYHAQIVEGDLTRTLEREIDLIEHMQIAGPPDRHEPDHGELNYPYLFEVIDRLGYRGWIGAEYRPRAGTRAGLGWAKRYGIG